MGKIVASWSPVKGYSGSTSNLLGVSSLMAVEEKDYSLLIDMNSTSMTARTLKGKESEDISYDSGIVSLKRLVKSGLLTPDRLTDCTDIIYKRRLDYLANDKLGLSIEELYKMNQVVLNVAVGVYDIVWVDASSGEEDKGTKYVLGKADVILVNLPQDKNVVNYFYSEEGFPSILKGKNYVVVVGKYDKKINYGVSQIKKVGKDKKKVFAIPYSADYQNAVNAKKVFEFFYKAVQEKKNKETVKYMGYFRKLKEEVKKILITPKVKESILKSIDDTDEKDE